MLIFQLITLITTSRSTCNYAGCSHEAICDVEFVAEAVYGCAGSWSTPGVENGQYLCGDGYSICDDHIYASSLGLTEELCLNSTLMPANYFYTSLQSSSGYLICDDIGYDDLFGCASYESDSDFIYFSDTIQCGPFGAQLGTSKVTAWQYGWYFGQDSTKELQTSIHITSETYNIIMGGVLCCRDVAGSYSSTMAYTTSQAQYSTASPTTKSPTTKSSTTKSPTTISPTTTESSATTTDLQTIAPLESCIIVYDDMDGAQKNVHLWSTEWTFSNESVYESFGWSDCNSDMCIRLSGHYPAMTRAFSNIQSYALTNVQIKYYIYAIRGYLIQYKWSDNEWTDLWYGDYVTGPINYIHNLNDPPIGDVSLSIRFQWFPYCDRPDLGYCDWSPILYIDNLYLMADMVSCPTEKPTTTILTTLSVTTQDQTLLESKELGVSSSGESKVVFSSEMVNVIIFIVGGLICFIVICCIVRACNNHLKSKKKTKYAVEEAWNNRQCKRSDQFTIEMEMEGILNNKTGANHHDDNDDMKCGDCDGLEQERNELDQEIQGLLNDQNEIENTNNQIAEKNKLFKSEDVQLTEQLNQSKKLTVAANSELASLKKQTRELNGKIEQIEESNKCDVDNLRKQNVALNQERNEMKQSNDNMQSEIVSLKNMLNSFEIEQKELLMENQQLEHEIKQFKMQTEKNINIDVTKYSEWNSNEIVTWIVSLDSSRYLKYKDILQQSLANEGVMGKHLCKVNEADIKGWGVVQFDDKKYLAVKIKQLINEQNK